MNLRISPRSKNDRGGVACMPLRRNVPEGREGWKLTTCPNCGRECWEMPLLDVVKAQGASALCTECALKQGAEKTIEKNTGAYAVYLAKKENIVNMKSKCGSMKELNRDLQEFFLKCGVTDEDVAVVKKNGEEYIVIEETVGQNIMHIIAEKMTAQGDITYAVADVSRWHKASGNKIMLKQVSNPFGIFLVSLFSTDSLNVFGMSKDNRTVFFQDVINRDPVFTGGFHTDIMTVIF